MVTGDPHPDSHLTPVPAPQFQRPLVQQGKQVTFSTEGPNSHLPQQGGTLQNTSEKLFTTFRLKTAPAGVTGLMLCRKEAI